MDDAILDGTFNDGPYLVTDADVNALTRALEHNMSVSGTPEAATLLLCESVTITNRNERMAPDLKSIFGLLEKAVLS